MWTCPKCKTEVEQGFEVCWSCGAERDGDRPAGFDPETEGVMGAADYEAEIEIKRREDLVTLGTFWTAPEAHVVRSRLEAEGIHAVVLDELVTPTTWANNGAGVKVEVLEADLDRARELLATTPPNDDTKAGDSDQVIAKELREGIREGMPLEPATEEEEKPASEMPDQLIRYAFRAMLLGFLVPCVPFHVLSLYLLFRSAQLPGQPGPGMQWRFVVSLVIDVLVTVFFWVPLALTVIYVVISLVLKFI